jgi:plastocyanin
VVVAIPEDGQLPAPKRTVEIVDQIDKEFVPYVKPVRVGSYVQFPNKDNIRHHVYSFSQPKKFELPLYSGTPSQPVLFDKPGIVKLGCNIHDWMLGYVYVTETPYFGKTGLDGRVDLDQLPPGRYVARVWHPLMEGSETATIKRIDLGDTASSLEWKLKLKSEFRPRRTPLPNEPGYR